MLYFGGTICENYSNSTAILNSLTFLNMFIFCNFVSPLVQCIA